MSELLTTGQLAEVLNVPVHRVEYFLVSRKVKPVQRAGRFRLFRPDVADIFRREMQPQANSEVN